MDYSPKVSSVHRISQARILGWVTMPSSRASSQPRDRACVFMSLALAGRFYPLSVCEIFVSPIMINVFFLSGGKKKKNKRCPPTQAKEIQNTFLGIVNKKNLFINLEQKVLVNYRFKYIRLNCH